MMLFSFVVGIVLIFLCGMDFQRIITERDATPAHVYFSFAITAILGLFNVVGYIGYVAGRLS